MAATVIGTQRAFERFCEALGFDADQVRSEHEISMHTYAVVKDIVTAAIALASLILSVVINWPA